MPKIGLTKSEWRERLSLFAQGNFKFGKGQRPPRGSDRARELERVEKCPKHSNTMQIDPFGRKIQCLCGYHQQQVSQMQSKIKSIARYALFFFTHWCLLSPFSLSPLCHLLVLRSAPHPLQLLSQQLQFHLLAILPLQGWQGAAHTCRYPIHMYDSGQYFTHYT